MLECGGVSVFYGELQALYDVSLAIDEGQIVSIVGANGAGKTTLLRAISGLERCRRGSIIFEGQEIQDLDPAQRVRAGISQVPAGRAIFTNLTVDQNLLLGAYMRSGRRRERAGIEQDLARVREFFPVLGRRAGQAGGTLSGGEQQMLAIGRALMARPRLLILDEPSLGLAPLVLEDIFAALKRLNDEEGLTILLVEQNAHLALDFASWAFLLETGAIVDAGPTSRLRETGKVAEIYLGIEAPA